MWWRQDSQALAYEVNDPHVGLAIRACMYRGQRVTHVGLPVECGTGVCEGIRGVQLAGTLVAYESLQTTLTGGRWFVVVRDLRSGRIIRHVSTGAPLKPTSDTAGVGPVTDLVVKDNGSAAWIADDIERTTATSGPSSETPYLEVYASDGSGTRLLASGTDIQSSSLALAGSTVYWTQASRPFVALLR